ncbi:hypothetical protein [Tsukamurella sp. 1534]|uniref:hypothetical protein n=1 Tax=Tsukamurella sp. 1534 TaxID=1151061 RepID=UPI0002F90123|nr:hypothetical protein [Tsukamurella sp. 1534]
MGNPDPYQNPGQHPGGQNYPAEPGGHQPTRPVERDAYGGTQGFDGAYPPPAPQGGPQQPPPPGPQGPQQGDPYGGYQLGYSPGAYGPQGGAQPPQGPPPPDWQGPGGGGGDGGGNKKLIWIAVAVVVFVLVLAGIVIAVATGGSDSTSASSETTPTTTRTTTAPSTTGGFTLPSGVPSDISIPPIFGGSTTGPNVKQWQVEVTGEGSAQVITVGVPDTNALGSQQLPWSKSFSTDTFLVSVTVIDPKPGTACKISRGGAVVSEETAPSGGGPLICTGMR